ncbi:xanthine dehydrogenase-like [Epargyreus clarus]|uniref:xanthine dehydrogenase-like n=1 Tax=Epargyreus clarus TaxID=520877 RepID=UPI003C2F83C4
MDRIFFSVNGVGVNVGSEVSSTTTLLVFLRDHLGLRGTKYMCLEGGCGACMVSVIKYPGASVEAVNSCLVSVTSCQGWEITTIEKLGNRLTGYHPLQTTLAENNGSQCGYCSPGFVMSMYSSLQNRKLTMLEIEKSLGSNICRCTGYRPILDAFKNFASDAPKPDLPDIEDLKICKKNGEECNKDKCDESDWCFVSDDEVMAYRCIPLCDGRLWYIVQDISDIFNILREKGDGSYMLVAGNTAKGVYPRDEYPRILIDISRLRSLKGCILDQNLVVGAGNTLTETMQILNNVSNQQYFGYLKIIVEHMELIAHIPVRNIGTIAGNLMIKHNHPEFSSDIFLLLNSVGAQIIIVTSPVHSKTVSMEGFLKENMRGKIILNVMFPPLNNQYKLVTKKIMPRAQNAHAMVNAGFLYKLSPDNKVQDCRIVYGGLSPTFSRATKTEKFLKNRKLFVNETLSEAIKVLSNEMVVTEDPPNPSVAYRRQLAIALFYKCLLYLCPPAILNPRYVSGATDLKQNRGVSKGRQEYVSDPSLYPLNEPIQKVDALIQCAGEASYTEDLPCLPHEVYAAFALTTVPLGTIKSIDASYALKYPGVIAFLTAKDIPGTNSFTPAGSRFYETNEELLCSGEVKYFNQPFGIIVAKTQHIANVAVKLVSITYYTNDKLPVIDVKLAKKDPNRVTLFRSTDATNPGNDVATKIKGNHTIRGQYHFCLETLVCVSRPSEEGLSTYPASQWMDGVQWSISRLLNINKNRIDVKIRRLGGTFGIKISRSNQIALACSLVAYKLNRPCRFIQSLRTNMRAVGKRLSCNTDFEIAVNNQGVIQFINEDMYEDDGYITNEPLIQFAADSHSNCYDKSKWNLKAYNVVTDTPSNTWCRSPGSLEAIAMAETFMERITYALSLDPIDVRLTNISPEIKNDVIEMVNIIKEKSMYTKRKAEIEKFNAENRWKKQGKGVALMQWLVTGVSTLDVNLSVYHGDGTVAIAHGGIELGQAINTKAVQICAYFLKIPIDKVQIKANDTTINPNGFITGGSTASQSVGLGVQRCCEMLLKNLEPIRAKMDNPTWQELILEAFNAGVDLQTHSHVNDNDAINYSVLGCTVAQVTVDVLTGQWEFDQVDLIEDVGQSVSPRMDIGQIEGAFTMGVGYHTIEELVYDKATGENLTDRTWNYKVPQARDIARDSRIYLRKKPMGPNLYLGAKATGEPATCMAVAVPFAIREAFTSARQESGIPSTEWYQIDGPYTVENICMAAATDVNDFKFY